MTDNRFFNAKYWLFVVLTLFVFATESVRANDDRRGANSVTIKIVDKKNGHILPGAVVISDNIGVQAISNREGVATMKNLPYGEMSFFVSMFGYETFAGKYNITTSESALSVSLTETSLEMEVVTVVATENTQSVGTSSIIERQALDHLQATSLKDIMQLLPGQLADVSDMTSAQRISIRTLDTTDSNSSFGTSIVVDGIPISDNATLSDKTAISSTGGNGVDLRQIGVDNVESVEVIRGIPSVEHGDLTSGAVIVKTKAGESPWQIRGKLDPSTLNASISKGWKIADDKYGSINVNADYLQAWGDPRTKSATFDRASGGVTYTKTFGDIWYTNTKVNYNFIIDTRPEDEDQTISQVETYQSQSALRISHNGRFMLNRLLSRTLSYSLGYSASNNESHTQSIVSINGGLPIITSMEEGYFEVPYYLESYVTGGGTISKPRSFYAKASNTFSINSNKVEQRFNMGAEYRREQNNALGYYNDDEDYPLRPNSSGRPRPYYDIPPVHTVSAYFEDNLNWDLSDDVKFRMQAGLRLDVLQPTLDEQVESLSPRINASMTFKERYTLRGGWGLTAKTPGLAHLYPETSYTDRVAAEYYIDESNYLVMYHTYVADAEESNLKNAVTNKFEVALDVKLKNKMSFSVVGYHDKTDSGFSNYTDWRVYNSNYYVYGNGIYINAFGNPAVDFDNPYRVDTVFTTTGQYGNTAGSLNRGVEVDFNFGRIKRLNTTFYLSGAFMETQSWSSGPNYSSPTGIDASSVYAEGGANTPPFKLLYPSGLSKSINRRVSTTARIVTNIPKMKLVASIMGQVVFYQYSHSVNEVTAPLGWLDTDLTYRAFTQEMFDDPDYVIKDGILLADQIKDPSVYTPVTQPPIWMINMRLTKNITNNIGFSFYSNNMFFYMPFQLSSTSTTLTERNTGTFSFGVELNMKM